MMSAIHYGLILAAVLSLIGCDKETDSPSASSIQLNARVVSVSPAFGENTVVDLQLGCRSCRNMTLLELKGRLSVVDENQANVQLHDLSVGVKKPIVIDASQPTPVSLLFDGRFEAVRAISLDGHDISVSE